MEVIKNNMYHLITIGDAVLDTHVQIDDATVECDLDSHACKLCLDYAAKVPITGSFQALGGNAANIAVGATKLGLNSAIITSLGRDFNGKIVYQELKKQKVSANLISFDREAPTRYAVILNFKGERTILSYHQNRKYAWPKKMPTTEWLYYTSLSAGFEPLQDEMLKFLQKHPAIKLAVNPGSFQLKSSLDKILEVLPKTDILTVNLEEAEKMAGLSMKEAKSVPALLHKLLALGPDEAVITDAAHGAWAGTMEEVWHMPTYPVRVVAKTGAGDAFSSGYLAARIHNHDLNHALEWGIANSCAVIQQLGAQSGLLDAAGINKMIEKYSQIKPAKVA